MDWWIWPLAWWAGMLPAAWLAGDAQKRLRAAGKEPHRDQAVILFVVGWPVFAVVAPLAFVHLIAQGRQGGRGGKPKQ